MLFLSQKGCRDNHAETKRVAKRVDVVLKDYRSAASANHLTPHLSTFKANMLSLAFLFHSLNLFNFQDKRLRVPPTLLRPHLDVRPRAAR